MSTTDPLQLAFYKGVGGKFGALQFNFRQPHYYCPSCKTRVYEVWTAPSHCTKCDYSKRLKSREGAVFMEISNTTAPNVYDWEHSTTFALSINDMAKILMVLEGQFSEMDIPHDPGAKSDDAGKVMKMLSISSPKGVKEGCLIRLSVTENGVKTQSYMVPLDGPELKRLGICIRTAIPASLSWS